MERIGDKDERIDQRDSAMWDDDIVGDDEILIDDPSIFDVRVCPGCCSSQRCSRSYSSLHHSRDLVPGRLTALCQRRTLPASSGGVIRDQALQKSTRRSGQGRARGDERRGGRGFICCDGLANSCARSALSGSRMTPSAWVPRWHTTRFSRWHRSWCW